MIVAAIEGLSAVNLALAFTAGLVSFASPCMLPLVPGYLGMLGASANTVAGGNNSATPAASGAEVRRVVKNALLFVAGFSIVFVALGFGSGVLGGFLIDAQREIQIVGGLLIVAFGLMILFSEAMPMALQGRRGAAWSRGKANGPVAVLFGVVFAAAWSPCIGPTLGSVLTLAATSGSAASGGTLLAAFSLGIGLPFVAVAYGFASSKGGLGLFRRYKRAAQIGSGVVLIIFGVLLALGVVGDLSSKLSSISGIEL